MKPVRRRSDALLVRILVVSLVIYLVFFAFCFGTLPLECPPWQQGVLLSVHLVPMFCLQLLLCRRARAVWRVLVPLAVLAVAGTAFLAAADWSVVGWVLFLYWCTAPVLGCVLAWVVWVMGEIRPVRRRRRPTPARYR